MNKKCCISRIFSIAAMVLLGNSMAAYADEKPSETAALYINEFSISPGAETVVSLNMNNTAVGITAFQTDILLPEGIHVDSIASGSRAKDQTVAGNLQADKLTYRLVGISFTLALYNGTNGEVAKLYLSADKSLANTTQHLKMSNQYIVDQSGTNFAVPDYTTTVNVTAPAFDGVTLDESSTTAPTASNGTVNVLVKRTIKPSVLNTIVLPFAMTGKQVSACFGNDVEVLNFTGATSNTDDNDRVTSIDVDFTTVNATSTGLEANHPYIIKMSSAVSSFEVDGVTISPETNPEVIVGKRKDKSYFHGTYVATTVPEECVFLSDNNYWYSVGKSSLKGYRGYFEFADVLDAYYDATESKAKINMYIDGMTTSIESYKANRPIHSEGIYTINGMKVNEKLDNLPKGIYIVNGKKIVK